MQPLNVVLLQSDPGTAQSLVAPLNRFFRTVREARSFGDVRETVAHHGAEVVIVDMEMAALSDVEGLARDFPGVCIVCNHRLADEQMWAAVLSAGAADCCASSDPSSIFEAARRNVARSHSIAA